MNCRECKWPAQNGDRFCVSCGAQLAQKTVLPDPQWDAKASVEALDRLPGHEHGRHVAPKAPES